MSWVGFEPTIPVFEQAKAVHALDRAPTVIGCVNWMLFLIYHSTFRCLYRSSNTWMPLFTCLPEASLLPPSSLLHDTLPKLLFNFITVCTLLPFQFYLPGWFGWYSNQTSGSVTAVRLPAWERDFLFSVASGSGAHPASNPVDTGGKAAGAWGSPLHSSLEVKNGGAIPPLPHSDSWHCS
jgi:hypothetical protein